MDSYNFIAIGLRLSETVECRKEATDRVAAQEAVRSVAKGFRGKHRSRWLNKQWGLLRVIGNEVRWCHMQKFRSS